MRGRGSGIKGQPNPALQQTAGRDPFCDPLLTGAPPLLSYLFGRTPYGGQAMSGHLLVVALVLGAPGAKEPKAHPIVGTWLILTRTHDGQTSELNGDHCWTFTADGRRGAHTVDTRPASWQKYALDEKVRPPALSVTEEYRTGPISEHFRFEVDGDTLTMCTRSGGRPEAITAEKGSGNTVYKLRRVKAKD